MQKCSYCGRDNSDEQTNCRECGTRLKEVLAPREVSQEGGIEDRRRAHGRKLMMQGAMVLFAGVTVTAASYAGAATSPYGGHYVIAVGAIVFGVAQVFRGMSAVSGTDTNDQAQELLNAAAREEGVNQEVAIALYEEVVRRFPHTRASREAQRNLRMFAGTERNMFGGVGTDRRKP